MYLHISCLIKHCAMQMYVLGSGGIGPHICNLSTRWSWL